MFRQVAVAAKMAARSSGVRSAQVIKPVQFAQFVRYSSHGSMLTKEDVLARTVSVLKSFDLKNSSDKITVDTQFTKDLGMDSLDYNDALVAIEEEFDVVFDDKSANEIRTVGETVDYVIDNYLPEQQDLDKEVR